MTIRHIHINPLFSGSQGSQNSLNNSPKRSQQALKEEESAEDQSAFEPMVNLKR